MKWTWAECDIKTYFELGEKETEEGQDQQTEGAISNVCIIPCRYTNQINAIQFNFDNEPDFKHENGDADDSPELGSRIVGIMEYNIATFFVPSGVSIKGLVQDRDHSDYPYHQDVKYWIMTNPKPLTDDEIRLVYR